MCVCVCRCFGWYPFQLGFAGTQKGKANSILGWLILCLLGWVSLQNLPAQIKGSFFCHCSWDVDMHSIKLATPRHVTILKVLPSLSFAEDIIPCFPVVFKWKGS